MRCVFIISLPCVGYTSLHLGAIWGKLDSLKLLVKRGADLQIKTTNGERARELALRYNQITCVEYLDYAGISVK